VRPSYGDCQPGVLCERGKGGDVQEGVRGWRVGEGMEGREGGRGREGGGRREVEAYKDHAACT